MNEYNYISHGYAATAHKAQGMTVERVIYNADTTKEASFNQAYVGLTRGKLDVRLYTNDEVAFREQVKERQEKTSALDVAERTPERGRDQEPVRGQEQGRDGEGDRKAAEQNEDRTSREVSRAEREESSGPKPDREGGCEDRSTEKDDRGR